MKLIYPEEKYLKFYQEARLEHELNGVTTYDFLDSSKIDIFELVFNFRHALTDSLEKIGGHIGYGIRYSMWNKGYGTVMLKEALIYAKEELGLKKVLITCNDDNIGSYRVIEKNGGILQDKIMNHINGKEQLSRRYWITIK